MSFFRASFEGRAFITDRKSRYRFIFISNEY